MRSSFLLLLFVVATVAIPETFKTLTPKNENGGVNWALLVAGSNSWGNYRHQADICHAYQVLKNNGFDDAHIVVMMFDDIAYNYQNPKPGYIFNREGGPDVYNGVPHDYTGNSVSSTNFYNILQGLTTYGGSGKTIQSTSQDNIFVFYSDHGSVGLICMPVGNYVYADELSEILKDMASQNKFNKFLFYLEACESGSMFYSGYLPANVSIFATTASTPYESSYACNYSPSLYTYLGDCYSVNWMDYTDSINVNQVSVQQEFEHVRSYTTMSTCCEYGDTSLSSDMLSVYMQGRTNVETVSFEPAVGGVSQRIVEEGVLKERYARASSNEERNKIALEMQELQKQRKETQAWFLKFGVQTLGLKNAKQTQDFFNFLEQLFDEHREQRFAPESACDVNHIGQLVFDNFQCYKRVTEMVRETCGPLDSYALQFTPSFASLCKLTGADYAAFQASTQALCPEPIWH